MSIRTQENTVVKQEPVTLTQESLNEFLAELLAELEDEQAWAARIERENREHEATWNPYDEQLSDTVFRWRAYEQEVE